MNDKEGRSLNMGDLTQQTSDLLRQEKELAIAEISEKISATLRGLIVVIIGTALLLVGLIYILNAAVYGLAEVLPSDYSSWLAALIVGIVTGLIGYILIETGESNLEPRKLMPDRAIDSLYRDKNMTKEKL